MCEIELSLREGFRPSPPGPGEDATTGGIPVSCCCRQVAEEKSACFGLLAGFFPTALKGVRRLRSQSPLRSGRGWAGAVQLPISVFTERVCAPLLSSPNLHPHSLKGCHPSQPSPEPAPALSWPQKVWKLKNKNSKHSFTGNTEREITSPPTSPGMNRKGSGRIRTKDTSSKESCSSSTSRGS